MGWYFMSYLVVLMQNKRLGFGQREGHLQPLSENKRLPSTQCKEDHTWSEMAKTCVEKPWSDFRHCVEEKNEGACKDNDWVKEHCVDTCALKFVDLITALDEGSPHATDIQGMECSPVAGQVRAYAGMLPSSGCSGGTPFYLDESGAFNMTEVHTCFGFATGIPINKPGGQELHVDDHVDNDSAQHLTDLHLLQQLRIHPMRTFDPNAASIHFTGITPSINWFFSVMDPKKVEGKCKMLRGTKSQKRRMEAATLQLKHAIEGLAADTKRVYVVVSTYWLTGEALTDPLISLMKSPLGKKRIIFATCDVEMAAAVGLQSNFMPVPYVASYRLDKAARALDPKDCLATSRDIDFFFAGTFQRCGNKCDTNEGALRGNVLRTIQSESNNSLLIDLLDADDRKTAGRDYLEQAELYAQRLLRSRFCLVPAGDTKTSRRIFEALAAGCIPVYLGYFGGEPGNTSMGAPQPLANGASNLPFRASVNWSSLVLFAGGLKCLNTNDRAVARLLGRMLTKRSRSAAFNKEFEFECKRRREVYRQSLSYYKGGGAATALLTELYNFRVPDEVHKPGCPG
jgi:hypothetical protein